MVDIRKSSRKRVAKGKAVVVVVVQFVTAAIVAGALSTRDTTGSGLNGLTPQETGAPVSWGVVCTTACVSIALFLSFAYCLLGALTLLLFATLTYALAIFTGTPVQIIIHTIVHIQKYVICANLIYSMQIVHVINIPYTYFSTRMLIDIIH